MLTIRPDQVQSFSAASVRDFEDRMVKFLSERFPEQCRKLGEPHIRPLISYGIERSSGYGLESERDVCQYIALMFVFGGKFDTDPQFPDLRSVLESTQLTGAGQKITALYQAAGQEVCEKAKPGTL